MFFGDETNMFLKDNKKPNIPLRQHYSHQEKKYQKLEYSPINCKNNILSKRKKSHKKVKFNDKIDIIYVESYKAYNVIEDDGNNFQEFIQNYKNYNNYPKKNDNNKKWCDDCTCHII